MAPPLIIRAVLDAAQYLKTAETINSVNTQLGEGALKWGADVKISGEEQIATLIKVRQAQEATLLGMKKAAAGLTGSDLATANTAIAAQQGRINRSLGVTTTSFAKQSEATKTAERDLGKFTRGALAGTGAAASLGRSLAFASTGFIAIAGGATLITASIKAAEEFEKTQRQADQQLRTSGKTWDAYGAQIQKTDLKLSHISGFTNQELLGSFTFLLRASKSVTESLRLNAVAADLARGRGITLQAASIALGKALGGSASALKRLGVPIPATLKGMQAIEFVARRYAGQAAAGATVSDHFRASLANFEVTVGTALLPTFNRLVTELSQWTDKMVRSGHLQRDVNDVVKVAGDLFHTLAGAVKIVDDVTGSFANTLKLIVGISIAKWVAGSLLGLGNLAAGWLGVADAAKKAEAAEIQAAEVAAGTGAVAGAGLAGGAGLGIFGAGLAAGLKRKAAGNTNILRRIGPYTAGGAEGEAAVAATGAAAALAASKVTALRLALSSLSTLTIAAISIPIVLQIRDRLSALTTGHGFGGKLVNDLLINNPILHPTRAFHDFVNFGRYGPGGVPKSVIAEREKELALIKAANAVQEQIIANLQKAARTGDFGPGFLHLPPSLTGVPREQQQRPLFGGAQRQQQFTQKLPPIPFAIQLAQAQAALTKSMTDDVAAAVALIKFIKKKMDEGVLHGQALIEGLQAIAGAQATIQQAQAAALAKRQAAAAKALAAASTYNIPGYLQLAQAKAEAYGKSETAILKKIIAAAEKAIKAGGKNWEGLVAAYGVIAQARQQLASDAETAIIPLKLQLALARAQARGTDQTAILEKMKRALERALKAAHGNIQRQIDIYHQIYDINQQLQSGDQSFLGLFKQASTKALTSNLNLTEEQRKILRARLSQLGPGGTTPGTGTGAFGYAIDPSTGRPDARRPQHHRRRRDGTEGVQTADGSFIAVQPKIDLNVYIDGQHVEATVTRRQQRRAQHNPNQRRGPQAGR